MGSHPRGAGRQRPERPHCLIVLGSLVRGGAERQAILTATALQASGIRTLLYVATPPLRLLDDARSAGVELDLPVPGETELGQLRRLRCAAERHGTDGVISFLVGPSLRFLTVRGASARARRLPWIVAERGNTHTSRHLRAPVRALLHARCLHGADRVVVNSSALGTNILSFVEDVGRKMAVVPNIVVPFDADAGRARDAVRELVGHADRTPILGALGSFAPDRNYELLAEAFCVVLRRHPRAHLVILGRDAGPGCDARAFCATIRRRGIEAHVTVAGDVANARTLLPGFDAVVMSSKLEGSSNALAEALIVGVPVAATPAGDAEQLAAGAAAISAGWTSGALADAIGAVLEDAEAWRVRSGRRGRELLAERSPERVAAHWRRVLEEAAEAASERATAPRGARVAVSSR